VVIRISIFLFFAQVIWLSCLRRTCNGWLNDHVLSGKLWLSSEPPILLLWKNRYLDHLTDSAFMKESVFRSFEHLLIS
jgi:hypothetical protein